MKYIYRVNVMKGLRKELRIVVVVDVGLMTLLTSQVISVAIFSEREKSYKFCSQALILA